MADIGYGYGSEWHLLRYLWRHRYRLDRALLEVTGADAIDWLDFHFGGKEPWWDGEHRGLDFISDPDVLNQWGQFWPRSGTPINWDAVGRLHFEARSEWLVVEAKAHVGELKSDTRASPEGGLQQIETALAETKRALGVSASVDWLRGYYQYCNRIAALHFLNAHGCATHLAHIYFFGDRAKDKECPESPKGWRGALADLDGHVQLPRDHPLAARVHRIYLDVRL